MRVKDLENDIDNSYINSSSYFKRFNSKSIDANNIFNNSLKENVITYKGTEFLLPTEVVNSKSKSKIDSITNSKRNSFFLNLLDNQLFQVDDEIKVDSNLAENQIYQIILDYQMINADNSDISLVIIEYQDNRGYKVRKYESNKIVFFKPQKKTTSFKVFIEPKIEMILYKVSLNITLENRKTIEKYEIDLVNNDLYVPNSEIKIKYENGVKVTIPELERDYIYISHKILNNSFNEKPENSFFEFKNNESYYVYCDFSHDDTLEVTPIIVEYNDYMKTNLIKLNKGNNYIKFQGDTKLIRLSYKFVGTGTCTLDNLIIKELEPESTFKELKWNTSHDMNKNLSLITDVKDLRIAVIMDDFTYFSYAPEANLTRLSFDNWKNEIIAENPHFIFIESAWHGNNEEWTKCIAYVTAEKHKPIKELINFANSLNIKVVFWNKEDPVHYDSFIETAKLCDYVFTTDIDRVDSYKKDCNHDNIRVLQFAAQPLSHNPQKIQKQRINGISFAGSYYSLREERSRDMNLLFKASIPYNLNIYDRNYEATQRGEKLNFLFPEEFRPYIIGSLPFYQIDKAYKGYKFMININTVKDSPTMFARRVYEGLASGTPIISNYSLGMEKQFGDIIGFSSSEEGIINYLNELDTNESMYNKVKQLGIRKVLKHHTYSKRLLEIVNFLGYKLLDTSPTVTFISFVENTTDLEKIIEKYNNINYSDKNMLIFNKSIKNDYSIINSRITVLSEKNYSAYFLTLNELLISDFIAPLNVNDFYGENYIEDLLLATLYTDADIIGKKNYYKNENNILKEKNKDSEHEYTNLVNLNSSIIKLNIFTNIDILSSLEFLKGIRKISDLEYRGVKIYSSDKMNYIKNGDTLHKELKSKVIV